MQAELRDRVMTNRLGKEGDVFEVVGIKGIGFNRTLQLKNIRTNEIDWVYEALCFAPVKLKIANIRDRKQKKMQVVDKILSKPVRKH